MHGKINFTRCRRSELREPAMIFFLVRVVTALKRPKSIVNLQGVWQILLSRRTHLFRRFFYRA